MPIFGRGRDGDAQARTAADRESARLERERRQGERERRARPDEPAAA